MAGIAKIAQQITVAGLWPHVAPATLALEFQFDHAMARTMLVASQQEPPLRVVRAFPIKDSAVLAHLHNVSGGLLGGDRLELNVRIGARARVQLTTTGATRIYRPRAESLTTMQSNVVVVGENALLEYVPDTLIPFAGACFAQKTMIRLAPGAGLFWWEILAPGREARGEAFEYERVKMQTEISAEGRLIAAEQVDLEPRKRALDSLSRLGPYRTWATFYVCCVGREAAAWLALENKLRGVSATFSQPGKILWGFSSLVANGLVARCVARHGRDVLPGLHAIWHVAKMHLYGCEAELPRKVN
jgi:urease accessory protein